MNKNILKYLEKPEVYAESTAKFWDDEHISKGMLEAHLASDYDAASRKHTFMDQSVDWIAGIVPPGKYPNLLDLGCGPGLYTQRFYKKGYQVTGMDYSRRSLEYAVKTAKDYHYDICYHYQNYLEISYQEQFDVITLIYCDFCVLCDKDRSMLLSKIHQALRPGGRFIVDVNTPNVYQGREETKTWTFQESGFWNSSPHLCLDAFYRYKNNTMLNQAVIVTEDSVQSYNLWDHTFTLEELKTDLTEHGFEEIEFYGDVAGTEYTPGGNTICAVAKKSFVNN